MKTIEGLPQPKKWTVRVIGTVKFLHDDREEQLQNFRAEYQQKLKVSKKHADQFARAEALRMAGYATREVLVGIAIIGKRILFG